MDVAIENLIKLGGGYILAAVGYVIIRKMSEQQVQREREIADERVANEKRFTEEQRALAEQYKGDRDCLLEVVKQNTAALTRLEAAFDSWAKAER